MRRNIYTIPIVEEIIEGTGEGVGIGGEGLGIGGEGVGIPTGEIGRSIALDGLMFYNVQMDRVLYYLTCSNGDSLGCENDFDLRAYNVS